MEIKKENAIDKEKLLKNLKGIKEKESQGFGLIEALDLWKREWRGMPEFIQDDQTSLRQIIVHFKSQEDVDAFAALVEQNLTSKTKFIWFPRAEIVICSDKRWIDDPNYDEKRGE